jgi:KDO2-lipid IV(A) lauroyltransferase
MKGLKNILKGASHRCEYYFTLLLSTFVRGLPLSAARFMADLLGEIMFRIIRIRRKVMLEQLGKAFPEKTGEELQRLGAACYRNLGRIAVEMVSLQNAEQEELSRYLKVKGQHHVDEALEGGKGLVAVTFHIGNWELGGAYIAKLGYPINAVVQRIHNPFIDRMVSDMRHKVGMKTISRKMALKGSIRALRANEIVVLLADQDAHESGVFVPFFLRPASTPRGPAVISIHCDAPAVMVFPIRLDDGGYEIVFEPVVFERQGDPEGDIERFTRAYTSRLEEYVRSYPEQWLWQHRRWKTQ